MAKLNKQEVNAIASKLHRKLEKAAQERRTHAIKHYSPSALFRTVEEIVARRDQLQVTFNNVSTELNQVLHDLREMLPFHCYSDTPEKEILDKLINLECKLPEVPSIDELKDDITISAIDESFDTTSFISEQLSKFIAQ